MRIFDCFMFYDEEVVLDIRLNSLKNSVDCFVIVESKFYHNGKKRDLKFDINKYPKFKDNIILYIHIVILIIIYIWIMLKETLFKIGLLIILKSINTLRI